ncbi:MAG: universal stress protein [Cardiobacteriaceae bacterium]|nr:universal stress protein [Cardiobacteriaceae bacterium]
MPNYKHVLLVTDLREDAGVVMMRTHAQLGENTKLSVLHIVEETVLAAGYEIIPIMPVIDETQSVADARYEMKRLLNQYGLEADHIHVETALSTRRGILDYVETHQPDLLVIGRHTRTGLASLLGATADDILPSVGCDVLVVKLGDPV